MASKDTTPEKRDSFKAQLDRAATGMSESSYSAQGMLGRVVETGMCRSVDVVVKH